MSPHTLEASRAATSLLIEALDARAPALAVDEAALVQHPARAEQADAVRPALPQAALVPGQGWG